MSERMPMVEKEKGALQRVLEVFRRATVMGMLGVATAQGAEGAQAAYIGHVKDGVTTEAQAKAEAMPLSVAEIRNMVRYDTAERMMLGTDAGLREVRGSEGEWGEVSFADIQELVDSGERSPIFGHTHPLSVYTNVGYSEARLDELRASGEAPGPMAPSFTDIIGLAAAEEHFDDAITLRGRAYDPTGVWEYSVDEDHEAIRELKNFREGLEKRFAKALNDQEREFVRVSGVGGLHPAKRIVALSLMPGGERIAEKFEKTLERYAESLSKTTLTVLAQSTNVEHLSTQLAAARLKNASPEEIQRLVQNYISTAASLGVSVTYTPYAPEP